MKEKIKNLIYGIEVTAKFYIQTFVESKYTNEEKKAKLDEKVIEYINGFPINPVIKFVLRPIIPYITQSIYNLIKTKISGVTK